MASKSATQNILLDMAPSAVSSAGLKRKADVVLIDGLIFLQKKGRDLCTLGVEKRASVISVDLSGTEEERYRKLSAMIGDGSAMSIDVHPEDKPLHMKRTETGTWGELGAYFQRLVSDAFAVHGVKRVILSFDKRDFISHTKALVQTKRQAAREGELARQKARDLARGVEPVQGIPFTIDELHPAKMLPYPWALVTSDKMQLTVVVQYIVMRHIIPALAQLRKRPEQDLIVDGHALHLVPRSICTSLIQDVHPELDASTPLHVRCDLTVHASARHKNTIGESDHVIFHYMHLALEDDGASRFRVLTNDTDLLVLSICMLEREHPPDTRPHIDLQIPTREDDRSTYYLVDVDKVVQTVTAQNTVLQKSTQLLAFAMYLKSHDYDDHEQYSVPFFNRIGQQKIVDAYLQHAATIGPLVQRAHGMLRVNGDAVKKLVYATYYTYYDSLKGKTARIYPPETVMESVTLLDIAERVSDKNADKKPNMRMCVPSDDDIVRKALRLQFFLSLCDDAVHGRASASSRTIPDAMAEHFGYPQL